MWKLIFDHLSSYFTPCAKNLGVLFDGNLGFDKQISAVVKSSFFQLRRLLKNKSLLSVKQFIHLFVLSRLDYCNSLYKSVLYNAFTDGPKHYCKDADRQTKVRSHLARSYFAKLVTSQMSNCFYIFYICL